MSEESDLITDIDAEKGSENKSPVQLLSIEKASISENDETQDNHNQAVSGISTCNNDLRDILDLNTDKLGQINLGENRLESELSLDNPSKDSSNINDAENDYDQSNKKSESSEERSQIKNNIGDLKIPHKMEEKVDTNERSVQEIDKKVKELKLGDPPQSPMSPSQRKVRKAGQTPRAKSTPSRALTSPPITRSKSRELRLQSTPGNLEERKESVKQLDDEGKVARGRQRQRKDL
ncbi:hypothetical protein NPIL_407581 [Nephila pilipes]|uniref:Uncharacterized protein n=1 Tax=Nephila pilipes TaxID=299642 RepID=A0A8X6PBA4_NEPPI|nr:hypothetical protein NPIL_407581 [Nephila pilipes]